MSLNVPPRPLSTENSLRIGTRWAKNESWLDYFTLFQSIIQMSPLPSWWLDEACQIMIPPHTHMLAGKDQCLPKCSLTDTRQSMKNSHAHAHSCGKTVISVLVIGPNCGKMSVSGRPVWGQHQCALELVAFNVSVTVVTDKQLKQHGRGGERNKYSQTSARGTGYPLSQTVALKSVKS